MTKRKKKNLITVVSLLLALIILTIVYLTFDKKSNDDSSEEETETISVASLKPEEINSFTVKTKELDLQLTLEKDTWKSVTEPDRPINQEYVKAMVNQVATVTAIKVIKENLDGLEDYGLKEPSVSVEASQKDGKKVNLTLGNKVSGGDGLYALVNEENKIYYVSSSYETPFQYKDIDMTAIAETPTIKAENIHHITIDQKEKEDFDIYYELENKEDKSEGGIYSWYITKPLPVKYTADASVMTNFLPNYTNFSMLSCIDYKGDDLSKYGLKDPMASIYVGFYETYTEKLDEPTVDPNTGETVEEQTLYEEKDIKVYLGDKDSEGNYYVKLEGSNAVYTMNAENIDKMLTVDAFKLISTFINLPFIETIDTVTIAYDNQKDIMRLERNGTEKKDGKEVTKFNYLYNDKSLKEESFKELYQIIIGAEYDTPIKEGIKINIKNQNPILSLTYELVEGEKQETSFYPYDESFYVVKTEKGIHFFADKREIDDILSKIKAFDSENK